MKAMAMIFQQREAVPCGAEAGADGGGSAGATEGRARVDRWLPGLLGGWTQVRDLRAMPKQTFREWFAERGKA